MTPSEKFQNAIDEVRRGARDIFEHIGPGSGFSNDIRVECLNAALSLWHHCNQHDFHAQYRTACEPSGTKELDVITGIKRGPDTDGRPAFVVTSAQIRVPVITEET